MASKKKVSKTVELTPALIKVINANLDDLMLDDLNDMFPGLEQALGRLNVETGASDAEEGLAAWVYGIDKDGSFMVSADQPHYVKGKKKSFKFNGKKFV